jgi:hypothetical protein
MSSTPRQDILFCCYTRGDFQSPTFHRYATFEDVCRAGDVYSGRVSDQAFSRGHRAFPLL